MVLIASAVGGVIISGLLGLALVLSAVNKREDFY